MINVRIVLVAILLMALTACGGGGSSSGGGGGGGVSLTVSITPDDGIALTQSATLSWSSDGTSATLITKEVATVQALNSEVRQDDKPRVIFEKEPDGRMKITHIFYEDDLKKVTQKAAAEEKTIATTALPPSGSMQVSPTKTTTYTIRATGTNGSAEKSVTLTVVPHTPDWLVLHYNLQPELWIYNIKAKTMRWENGTVEVYDSTGFARLQEALDGWNQAIGGPVTFRKSTNPNSPIKIREDAAYIDQLGPNICGVAPSWIANASANDYRIIGANIILYPTNPNKCTAEKLFTLIQHEMGHAIGFNRHTNMGGANIMDAPSNFDAKILPLTRIMINRLYELPVGTELY